MPSSVSVLPCRDPAFSSPWGVSQPQSQQTRFPWSSRPIAVLCSGSASTCSSTSCRYTRRGSSRARVITSSGCRMLVLPVEDEIEPDTGPPQVLHGRPFLARGLEPGRPLTPRSHMAARLGRGVVRVPPDPRLHRPRRRARDRGHRRGHRLHPAARVRPQPQQLAAAATGPPGSAGAAPGTPPRPSGPRWRPRTAAARRTTRARRPTGSVRHARRSHPASFWNGDACPVAVSTLRPSRRNVESHTV